ncbi:hypothetical protein OEG86_20565 [Hoeflea alexandrii]|uniref:hypothetical protein n=1 Tax=Hoeflea alexandrii TaxID=288436 RepID=UPI00226DD034|nr:hypothetical protein [Hoeflea alexandrii]MCY0154223.1 hypothetical protein [Hoeflea alexandrii]
MTTWQIFFRALLLGIVLLILIFLTGCADGRFVAAERERASAEQVEDALSVAEEAQRIGRAIPEYPDACRRTHRSGVKDGDRLDAALVKTDRALSRANGQIRECAGWYDDVRKGFAQ